MIPNDVVSDTEGAALGYFSSVTCSSPLNVELCRSWTPTPMSEELIV